MKNVHVIPTDKPSRLFKDQDNILNVHGIGDKQHIYITNNEVKKHGDWVFVNGFILRQVDYINGYMVIDITGGKHHNSVCKKIILTTDQDLIEDGVQAIDDEFLEWFVKNQSCEWVEVESMINMIQFTPREFIYKIIIPQEEPKLINNCPKCGLDLVEREGSKPVCHRVDCGGIILSNETLREWELKKRT